MARSGFQLGLSHERVIYDLPETYEWGKIIPTGDLEVNRRLCEIASRHGIAVHCFHSNIDLVPWGMPQALLAQLGWAHHPADWSRGIPVVRIPPTSLGALGL